MIMPTPADLAKRNYSQELAAYTFEQWRIARQQQEAARNSNNDNNRPPSSADRRSGSPRDRERDEQQQDAEAGENVNGHSPRSHAERNRLRVHDFATSTAPLVNGTA